MICAECDQPATQVYESVGYCVAHWPETRVE